VLRWRDEEIVVDAARLARCVTTRRRRSRALRSRGLDALEKIDGGPGRRFLLDEVPMVGRRRGRRPDGALETVLSALSATLVAPETAALYGLGGAAPSSWSDRRCARR
jgi:hypothetical protein